MHNTEVHYISSIWIHVDIYAIVGVVAKVGVSAVGKKSVGQSTVGQKT